MEMNKRSVEVQDGEYYVDMSKILSKTNGDFVLFYTLHDDGEPTILSFGPLNQKGGLKALATKRLIESNRFKTNPSQ